MMITPYKLPERSLLVWYALPVFSLLIFQPAPQITTARVGPGVPVAQWPADRGPQKSFSSRQPRELIVSGAGEMGQGIQILLGGRRRVRLRS